MKIIRKYTEPGKMAFATARRGCVNPIGMIPAKPMVEIEISEAEEAAIYNNFYERTETPEGWRGLGPILQVEEGSWRARYIQRWVKKNLDVAYDSERNVVTIAGLEIELEDERRNVNIIGSLFVSIFLHAERGHVNRWYLEVEEKAYPGENWTMKAIAVIQLRNDGSVWVENL